LFINDTMPEENAAALAAVVVAASDEPAPVMPAIVARCDS
jgi:hypothetical protein